MSQKGIPDQRAIVDRRALAGTITDLVADQGAARARPAVVEALRSALAEGRAEIARRLSDKPSAGRDCAAAQAFLVDQLVRVIHDHVITDVYPLGNRSVGDDLMLRSPAARCARAWRGGVGPRGAGRHRSG